MRAPRRLLLVLLGVVGALIALELALQVVAFVLWTSRAQPNPGVDGARTVLCVGDSFTYGLGASDRENAYPAAAQRALADLPGDPVRVVNLGWPGQTSAEVLARLVDQLARYRPRLVYVLVGYNDFWGDDAAVADPQRFPLQLRTLRLFSMIAAALGGGPPDNSDAAFLGAWHAGRVFLDFHADGRIDTSDGLFEGVWALGDGCLVVEMPGQDATLDVTWRIAGDRLVLTGGLFGEGLVFDRGMPSGTAFDRGRAAARAGDPDGAERAWREALADPAQEFDARIALAELLAGRGREDDARVVLAPAREGSRASSVRACRWIEAAVDAGALEPAFDEVVRTLRSGPVDSPFVELIIRHALGAPDRAGLDRAIRDALTRDDLIDDIRLALLGLRAGLDIDPDAAIDSLIELARIAPDDTVFERTVRWRRDAFPREHFVQRAQRLPEPERLRVVAAFDRAVSTGDRTGDVLAGNLRAVVAACRRAGAEPVLMTYPGSRADVAAVVRPVAAELGIGLVDHLEHFESLLRATPRERLFVADGHCSDGGYVEMGRAVADDARARLQ